MKEISPLSFFENLNNVFFLIIKKLRKLYNKLRYFLPLFDISEIVVCLKKEKEKLEDFERTRNYFKKFHVI